jgi:hypothetical protein
MTKKRVKAARKKSAKKTSKSRTTTGSTSSPALKRELIRVVGEIATVASGVERRFRNGPDNDAKIVNWDDTKKYLDRTHQKATTSLKTLNEVVAEARRSGDLGLKQAAALVEASGLGTVLGQMETYLGDQSRAAQAPLGDEEIRKFGGWTIRLKRCAGFVARLAERLEQELDQEDPGIPVRQFTLIRNAMASLGELIDASLGFAEAARDDGPGVSHRWVRGVDDALTNYELAIKEITKELSEIADNLEKAGRRLRGKQFKDFIARSKRLATFDRSIINDLKKVIGAAIRLPRLAADAAAKLNRITRELLPEVTAELSRASGGGAGTGDSAPPEMIRDYADLKRQERIVANVFRRLAAEAGPLETLTVPEVIAKVGPELRSQGLAASDPTIKAIVKKLSSPEESILLAEPAPRIGGHGGALQYRLTIPAGRKYSPGVAAPERPGPLAPAAKAEQPA